MVVADPLTKIMESDFLLQVVRDNRWNYAQPEDAKADKAKNQEYRRSKKDDGAGQEQQDASGSENC